MEKEYNVLAILSLFYGYRTWILKQRGYRKATGSRNWIHEKHRRIQFIIPQKT